MNYRAEIDGLRAIAVLPVIFFHAGFSPFSGGFVGVDVFFVISGYLITSIIYHEMIEQRFSIWRFYERRARRILPALFAVSLACIPFAWFWMLPHEFKDFSQSLVGVATFTSNFLFWRESGYFADPAELKPLLHTWSLAVEEQYYILYPLLLLLFYRFVPKRIFLLISLGGLASLVLAHWASSVHPSANFYLLPSRAWELGVGALVALYLHHSNNARMVKEIASDGIPFLCRFREAIGLFGLALIVYAILAFDESTPFPSLWALIPVVGTALIILVADSETLVGRLLSQRLLVGIGLISYSAYLWHQPLFAFTRIRLLDDVPLWIYWALIATTFALAWITWHSIEVPARQRIKLPRAHILIAAAVACAAIMVIGMAGYFRGDFAYPTDVVTAIKWRSNISPVRAACHATENKLIHPTKACVLGNDVVGGEGRVYVWGDSHGVELSYAIAQELNHHQPHMGVTQLTSSQCIPTPNVFSNRETHCAEHNGRVYDFLRYQAQPGIVVLVARWPLYLIGQRVEHENGCKEGDDFAGRYLSSADEVDREKEVANKIQETISGLIELGHKVVFVHAVPEPGCNVPGTLARYRLYSIQKNLQYSSEMHLQRKAMVSSRVVKQDDEDFIYFDPTDIYCDTNNQYCFVEDEIGLLHFDSNHPSLHASKLLAEGLVSAMHDQRWF